MCVFECVCPEARDTVHFHSAGFCFLSSVWRRSCQLHGFLLLSPPSKQFELPACLLIRAATSRYHLVPPPPVIPRGVKVCRGNGMFFFRMERKSRAVVEGRFFSQTKCAAIIGPRDIYSVTLTDGIMRPS